MRQEYRIKCDGCGSLNSNMEAIRTCGFCEKEGCIDCVKYRTIMKGIINTWIHNKNTSNYGRSCLEQYYMECKNRSIDPDL